MLNLALDLLLCQERQEGNRRSSVCILKTISREMMIESKISRAIIVAAIIFVDFWGFLCECVMWFTLKR
jgi:hypothetical protein